MRQLYSINGVAEETQRDRSVFKRALADVPPDSKAAGKSRYYLSTIITALLADAEANASTGWFIINRSPRKESNCGRRNRRT